MGGKERGLLFSPEDIGLPYANWRRGQDIAVNDAMQTFSSGEGEGDGGKRFMVQTQPTGAGKSLSYIALSRLLGGRCLILTSTKGLQNQLLRDFHSRPGIEVVMGRRAYRCVLEDRKISCQEAPCVFGYKCPLKERGCDYYGAISRGRIAPLVVTNYAFWISHRMRTETVEGVLGDFDLLVLDEGHDTVQQLLSCIGCRIKQDEIRDLVEWPSGSSGQDELLSWARRLKERTRALLKSMSAKGGEGGAYSDKGRKQAMSIKSLFDRMERISFIASNPDNMIIEHQGRFITYDPIWPAALAEQYLFQGVPHVLMTSATITMKVPELLGLHRSEVKLVEYPSFFPVQNRPFIHIPTVRVDYRTQEVEMNVWHRRIDKIIETRIAAGRRGIVHTVSYKRRADVMSRSRFKQEMITHDAGTTRSVVEAFKVGATAPVLVSPSIITGWDFPYDTCRYQIITKIGFPDSRSVVEKARAKIDKEYGCHIAMNNLIQTAGRGVRAPDDYCETFIIDDHWDWFKNKYRRFAPRWFQDSWSRHTGVPDVSQMPKPENDGDGALMTSNDDDDDDDDGEVPW